MSEREGWVRIGGGEPPDGLRLTVRVELDVPMIYHRANGTMRAGWFTEERFEALGFAVEEAAIDEAKREARVQSHFAGVVTALGGSEP